jgi:membrane protease YdiL (CAAX protease family)
VLEQQGPPHGPAPESSAGGRHDVLPSGAEADGGAADVARPAADPAQRTPTWNRLTSLMEVIICSGFPTQVLLTALLMVAGLNVIDGTGRLSLAFIVWLSALDTALIVFLVPLFLRARGEQPSRVLLGGGSVPREALIGGLLLPVAFGLVVGAAALIDQVAPWLRNPDGNPLADLLRRPLDIAVFAVVAVVAGGLREEVQRAFILHRFEQHLGGAVPGLVIFSLAFGLGHALQGWDAAVLTALLGAFWGAVYLRRRSLVAAAVCHALFNLIEIAFHGLQA